MRGRLAWGLTLPLVLAGSQAAHALAYALVYPQAQVRASTLLTTGHAYLSGLPFALALAAAAAFVTLLVTAVDAARRRPARDAPAWAFALLAPATFVLQELLELSLHTGTFGWHAFLAPTFVPGLACYCASHAASAPASHNRGSFSPPESWPSRCGCARSSLSSRLPHSRVLRRASPRDLTRRRRRRRKR